MIRLLLCSLLLSASGALHAQQNLYVSNGISRLDGWPVIEYGAHVYYLSTELDTAASGVRVLNYYFSSVNKHSHGLIRSVPVFSDTLYPRMSPLNISYTLNRNTNRFSFFMLADVDSSLNETSAWRQYPSTLWMMQLDTGLNTVLPAKPLLHTGRNDLYHVTGLELPEQGSGNRIVLSYQVADTTVFPDLFGSWFANKLLMVDDTGRILSDEFFIQAPRGGRKAYPVSAAGKVYQYMNGMYAALTTYVDSFGYDLFTLNILDSNLQVAHGYDYPYHVLPGLQHPGRIVTSFGGYRESLLFLPGGSYIRSTYAHYIDTLNTQSFVSNAIAKAELGTGYRPSRLYVAPMANAGDVAHSLSEIGFKPMNMFGGLIHEQMAYNSYDQRLYTFSSTESEYWDFCVNNRSNLGQIVALDTNLEERWVKYIRPRANHCIVGAGVAAADGRPGVLVYGWERDQANAHYAAMKPFIYYIDSATTLGLDNPQSPLTITGQFSLYPNPATDRVVIENVPGTGFTYSIINSLGQTVASGAGQGARTNVSVQALPSGLYLVQVQTWDNKRYSLKFLKNQ